MHGAVFLALQIDSHVGAELAGRAGLPVPRLGCVDVRFPEIDTEEQITARVEAALAHVAPERISLNPDCGFAPGSQNPMDVDEAFAKLRALGRGAALLRERHG